MPLTPDAPFPKAPGNAIKSKDWNDAVNEVIRLDNAKVNRAGADAMAGPLTIASAMGVGTTSPGARLHVVDSANPAVARVQSTAGFGAARVEMWSDPQGSGTEWRPGYLESMDKGGFTGGLKLMTNGTGQANRMGAIEGLRVVNGNVGVGGVDPGYRMDVNGRMRVRAGRDSAGIWFNDSRGVERAFVGMMDDRTVGLYANNGAEWAFQMDCNTGNVTATGDVKCNRVLDQKYAAEASADDPIRTISESWVAIPNLALTFTLQFEGFVWIIFHMPGTQAWAASPNAPRGRAGGGFRITVDGEVVNVTRNEWHNDGWELRSVFLTRRVPVNMGTHTVKAEWAVATSGCILSGCQFGDGRTLQVIQQQ